MIPRRLQRETMSSMFGILVASAAATVSSSTVVAMALVAIDRGAITLEKAAVRLAKSMVIIPENFIENFSFWNTSNLLVVG